MKRRTFTGSAVAVAAALTAGPLVDGWLTGATRAVAAPAGGDPVTDLGEPVHKVQALASGIGTVPDGVPMSYYVVSGNQNETAEFAAVDLRTQKLVFRTRVPYGGSSQRALAISPVDGAVWFATSDIGHVYRYSVSGTAVDHIAQIPNQELAWSMAVGDDGTVWFGTYPSGSLYSIDPATGALTHHGQAIAGEQYIQAIAPVGDTVYVGTEPNAKMATYDRNTKTFTELAMPTGHTGSSVTALDVRAGRLFVSTTQMYVRDLAAGTWVDTITGADARVSPVDPLDPDAVYLRQGGEVTRYSLSTGTLAGTGNRPNATPESWGWVDRDGTGEHPLLALTYWRQGRTYGFAIHGGTGFYLVPDLMGSGAPLISLGTGPEGSIFAGAYLSPPGMGRYDPDDGTMTLLSGTSQVEGFGTFDGKLVFGRYPQGALYLYDPAQPWAFGTNPPSPVDIGDEQNRPQSFAELPDIPGTVAIASVPEAGRLGGAITLWQPYTGEVQVHRGVVRDQTPVGLIRHGDVLLCGTSIQGGYGIDPVADEAVLFAWDPATTTAVWTATPVPGASAISGLAIAPDGHLWGVADGRSVFEYDLKTSATLRTITIDATAAIPRYGDGIRLRFDHGRLFGSLADRLFVLDTITREVTVLYGKDSGRADGVAGTSELTQDHNGNLYVIGRGTHLIRYRLPADVIPPTVRIRTGQAEVHGQAVWLDATDDTDPSPRIDISINGGEWREHTNGSMLVLRPGQKLAYRAIDSAWNSTPVQHYAGH